MEQRIQVVEYVYIDEEDWIGGEEEEEEVVEFVEQVVRPCLKRRSSSVILHPNEVGIEQASVDYQYSYYQQQEEQLKEDWPLPEGWSEHFDPNWGEYYYYNAADGTSTWKRPEPEEDCVLTGENPVEEEVVFQYINEEEWKWGEDQDEVVEMEEKLVGSRRRSTFSVQPHEVGIGEGLADLEVEYQFIDEEGDFSDSEDEVVEIIQEILRPFSLFPRRSSMTIRPEEVGIGVHNQDTCKKIPKKARFKCDDSVSMTSITSRSVGSDSEHPIMESLSARASMRLSVAAAKAVVKLKEKLVTAQLRDRLREHRKNYKPQEQPETIDQNRDVPIIININGEKENPWAEIIGAISTAAKKLKPVPKHAKRDSSNFVNQDIPYFRELQEVQAKVLPVWRRETYSYWI